MDNSDLMQLINKCTDNECIKAISHSYMLSQIFTALISGIFICLGLFILCKYFVKYFK